MPSKPISTVSDFLSAALSSSRAADSALRQLISRVDRLRRLQSRWASVVPMPLRAHLRPAHFERGQLLVEADSPAWATRAHHQKQLLIERLAGHEEFAGLAGVRIRVSPLENTRPVPGARSVRISADTAKLLNATADAVSDPALKAALHRLAHSANRTDLR